MEEENKQRHPNTSTVQNIDKSYLNYHQQMNQHANSSSDSAVAASNVTNDSDYNLNKNIHGGMDVSERELKDYFKCFPPGYRFCPLDSELIVEYLRRKIKNEPLPPHQIRDVNLYKYSPDKISEMYPLLGEKDWYFFTPRDKKYLNGTRPNRAAGTGYWKATGADKPIKLDSITVGFRKALVFYEGKPPKGEKTNWIMHEFRVNAPPRKKSNDRDMRLDDYVLCKIYKKTDKSYKGQEQEHDGDESNDYLSPVGTVIDPTVDSHRDYSSMGLQGGGEEIPQMQMTMPMQSEVLENGNILPYYGYEFKQPQGFIPLPPGYTTTTHGFRSDGLNEAIQDWDTKLLPEFDYQSIISFTDTVVNLDKIFNSNTSSDSPDKSEDSEPNGKHETTR